jgi:hypothetical protein
VNFVVSNRLRGAGAALAVLALLLVATARPAAAQQLLSGRVVRAADSAGVGGARVVLHRVTRTASGPVDSTVAAPDGSFRMSVPPAQPDPSGQGFTVFFATAEVEGVRYFGRPLHAGDARTDYRIVAYDTTSSAAYADSVRVSRRDVAMIPEEQGGWEVGEIVRLSNLSHRTIVPAAGPILSLGLPEGATTFEVGEGEFGKQEVLNVRGRMYVTAPLPPGSRELFVRYRIFKGHSRADFSTTLATDTLNVFLREPVKDAKVTGLSGPRPFMADSNRYAQFIGFHLPKGAPVVLTWKNPLASPIDPKLAALVLTGAILLAGVLLALRRGRRAGAESSGDSGDSVDGRSEDGAGSNDSRVVVSADPGADETHEVAGSPGSGRDG